MAKCLMWGSTCCRVPHVVSTLDVAYMLLLVCHSWKVEKRSFGSLWRKWLATGCCRTAGFGTARFWSASCPVVLDTYGVAT